MYDPFDIAVSPEERNRILEKLTGIKWDGTVDYDSFDNNELIQSAKRDRAQKEMVAYLTQCIQEEFNTEDPLIMWEDYKEKHGIRIKELLADD